MYDVCYAFSWSYKTNNEISVKHTVKSSTPALFGWASVGNTNPCFTDNPLNPATEPADAGITPKATVTNSTTTNTKPFFLSGDILSL